MSTPFYDLASLVVVPSGYKASKVYAQKPLTTDGQLAFTRSTTATRVNSAGLIESVAINVPRLDYLNSTCPRLLLEPQRSNIVLYSEQMDNASWIKLNGSVTANAAVSPDGYTNADSFVPSTTLGIHALRSNLFNQSATAAHSWFVKANGYSKVAVRESELVGNYASFNLATGTLISTDQTGSIVNYGNGWYRLTLVDTTTGVNAQASIVVLPDSYTTGTPLINWSGDGTKGVLAYGAQVELGAYATSYIPTLGAAVTRGADAASKTGISSLIGQTEGTIFFEINSSNFESYTQRIFSISDDTNDNAIGFQLTGANEINYYVEVGGVLSALITKTAPAITLGQNVKVAAAYKANDFVLYVGGVQVGTDSSGGVPATSVLRYANPTGNAPYIGKVVQTLLFPTRLSNADLAALTA